MDRITLKKTIRSVAKEIYEMSIIGADVLEISRSINNKIYNIDGARPLHPLSIELGPVVQNYSPIESYEIRDADVMSFTLGMRSKNKDVGLSKIAICKCFSEENDFGNVVVEVLNEACKAGLKECGPDAQFIGPQTTITEILESNEIKSVVNVCGHQLNALSVLIPNIPPMRQMYSLCNGRMKTGDSFYIDVYGTNCNKHLKATNSGQPSIYFIPENPNGRCRNIKRQSIAKLANRLFNKYNIVPFSAKLATELAMRMGNAEKSIPPMFEYLHYGKKHQTERFHPILQTIPCKMLSETTDDEKSYKCAHVGRSIEITENGRILI